MDHKHGGCWYCSSTNQQVLTALQKRIIDKDGNESSYSVAICDVCTKAPVLDQRIPMEQRKAA